MAEALAADTPNLTCLKQPFEASLHCCPRDTKNLGQFNLI